MGYDFGILNKDENLTSLEEENRVLGYQMVCPTCGKKFFMSCSHIKWYQDKGLEIPRKCPNCRKKARVGQ